MWLTWYLKEADVDVNTSYPWANNGSSDCYDVQNAITHEIGHLLGLKDLDDEKMINIKRCMHIVQREKLKKEHYTKMIKMELSKYMAKNKGVEKL